MRQKFLLLLCVATLGLASCKKETYIQEPQARTYNYTIQPNQWVSNSGGLNYTANIKLSALDKVTLDDEGVLVYLSHPANNNSDIQLPYTYDVNSYTYELYIGGINIDIQSSDAQATAPKAPTKPVFVKIVVVPSKYAGNAGN
eukprot:gene16598-19717_t